jgi:hypothetical protein
MTSTYDEITNFAKRLLLYSCLVNHGLIVGEDANNCGKLKLKLMPGW